VNADDSSLDTRLSAIVVLAPALLGGGQLYMHKLSPNIAKASIAVSFLGTAGAWTDTTLSLIFSCLWIPCLIAMRWNAEPPPPAAGGSSAPSAGPWGIVELVHGLCSAAIFCFLLFHRLSLHWIQPWLYVVGLYVFCFDPLPYTIRKIEAQLTPSSPAAASEGQQQQSQQAPAQVARGGIPPAQLLRFRLWRPGVIGPLACVVPATFWTIYDEKYASLCSNSEMNEAGLCTDSASYQLFLLLPVVLSLFEWSLDEICMQKSRHASTTTTMVESQQIARVSCLVQLFFSAMPFRVYLFIAEHISGGYYEDRYLTEHNLNYTNWPADFDSWRSFLPLDTNGSGTAGFIFTAVVASALILNTLLCAVLHSRSSVMLDATPQTAAAAAAAEDTVVAPTERGREKVYAPAYVSGVPPTQGMAFALLALAILDYYTPLLAAPLCIAACYTSYVGYMLKQREGMWPNGLLAAIVVWVCKAGIGVLDSTEKARLGIHFFGRTPEVDLADFLDDWDLVWPPMMGTGCLIWGAFVRIRIVQKWPEETVGAEFSWQRLFYAVDAVVFCESAAYTISSIHLCVCFASEAV
jgi:hypothetical protein